VWGPARRRDLCSGPAESVYDAVVNWVVLIAGVVGLAVAAYGLTALVRNALRTRSYWDIGIAAAVMLAVIVALVAFGDRLIR